MRKSYKQILTKPKTWPIVKLANNKKSFLNDVSKNSIKNILNKLNNKNLFEELETTVYKEKLRISNISWKADPADDKKFWYSLKEKIVAFENDRNNKRIKDEILPIIIDRYTKEITGNFRRSHHGFARRLITSFLASLLNTARLRNPFGG